MWKCVGEFWRALIVILMTDMLPTERYTQHFFLFFIKVYTSLFCCMNMYYSKGKGLIHFKKLCAFGLLCFHLPRIYQGFLIWSYIITWEDDADGYDLVVIDAMHKANYASLICHSCHPHCEAKWVPLAYSFCCL